MSFSQMDPMDLLRQDLMNPGSLLGPQVTVPGAAPAAAPSFWNILGSMGQALAPIGTAFGPLGSALTTPFRVMGAPLQGFFSGPASGPATGAQPGPSVLSQPAGSTAPVWNPVPARTASALPGALTALGIAGATAAPFLMNQGGVVGPMRLTSNNGTVYAQSTNVLPGFSGQNGLEGFKVGEAPGQIGSYDQLRTTQNGWLFNHQGAITDAGGKVVGYQNPLWLNPKTGQYIRADQARQIDGGGWSYGGTQYATGYMDLTKTSPGADSLDFDQQKALQFFNDANRYQTYAQGDYLHGGDMRWFRDANGKAQLVTSDGRHLNELIQRGFDTRGVGANSNIYGQSDFSAFDQGTGLWGNGPAPSPGAERAQAPDQGANLGTPRPVDDSLSFGDSPGFGGGGFQTAGEAYPEMGGATLS